MMEAAEHEMLRSLGLTVMPRPKDRGHSVTWPRIAAKCDYFGVARFEDILQIAIQVAKIGTTSVEYRFRFTRDDDLIAEGTITVVCCLLGDDSAPVGQRLTKTPIPERIRELLAQYQ